MSDSADTEERVSEEEVEEVESEAELEEPADEDLVLGADTSETSTTDIDRLEDRLEEQREQIEELNDLVLDLSTRVAHGGGVGVCPDCHGAVSRINRFIRPSTIECEDCGRVFHEY